MVQKQTKQQNIDFLKIFIFHQIFGNKISNTDIIRPGYDFP